MSTTESTNLINDPAVQQALSRYQLGLPRLPTSGRSGELLGRGTGSSLEFQDYREYLPGDDLRHVDWAAYARSDALMVRLFREEISPRTEILLDASTSMQTHGGAKWSLSCQLTSLFAQLVGKIGGSPQIYCANETYPPLKLGLTDLVRLGGISCDGQQSLAELIQHGGLPFKPQSVRIVISDFLFPHDPDRLLKSLAGRASSLWLIQILADWEARPRPEAGRRLLDVETGEHADLMLTSARIEQYLLRLQRMQAALQVACRRNQSIFVTVVAEQGLETVCQQSLIPQEILRPV